jgi:ABC-type nitrate/sulfonate/bicarbonate transport system ATPase subunit
MRPSAPELPRSARPVKLSVRGVSKSFGLAHGAAVQAIDGVSFDVLENELCVLLGPSGCGKSTVLRMVAGLEEPTDGIILLDVAEIRGPGRDRGMVFQSYTSFPWLTVRQNVEYGMRVNSVPAKERRERSAHFIELVQLTAFSEAYPKQLSGGMKQRVAIARTLANDPAILLMDEPFGALDAETRWQMQELLLKIIESSKTTVLLVTHDIEEAIFLADRIVFMKRSPGRVRVNLVPEFKRGSRASTKEQMIADPGYATLESEIMRMMREEGRHDQTIAA